MMASNRRMQISCLYRPDGARSSATIALENRSNEAA
jgi:hypothetical protein